MNKKILWALAAMTLLASCARPNSSATSSTNLSSDSAASAQSPTYGSDDSAKESKEVSNESSSAKAEFPAAQVASFLADFGVEVTIPAYEASNYDYAVDDEFGCYTISSTFETSEEADALVLGYADILSKAGFAVTADTEEGSVYYTAFDADELVEIVFYNLSEQKMFVMDIYALVSTEFPQDSIDTWLEGWEFTGVTIPSFVAETFYHVEEGYFGLSLTVYVLLEDEASANKLLADYVKALQDASYTLDDYYGIGLDETEQVCVEYAVMEPEVSGDPFMFGITLTPWFGQDETVYVEGAEFPAEFVQDYLVESGYDGALSVPSYTASAYEYAYDGDETEQYLTIRSRFDSIEDAKALEGSYAAALSDAGWDVYDDEYEEYGYLAYSEAEDVELQFYAEKEAFGDYYFYLYVTSYATQKLPETGEEDFSEAVAGATSEITFDSVLDIIAAPSDHSSVIWNNGAFSFVLEKGASDQNVGNFTDATSDGYLADPLRAYGKQVLTIRSELPIASVSFETDGSKYASALVNSTASVGNLEASGSSVTWTLDEAATTMSITLGAQVRFASVSVAFAA